MLLGCSQKRFDEEARERGAELLHQERKTLPGTPFAPATRSVTQKPI